MHIVHHRHALFGVVEEVIQQMLVPGRSMGWRETSDADGEEVHVKEGNLCPGAEGRGQTELCVIDVISSGS